VSAAGIVAAVLTAGHAAIEAQPGGTTFVGAQEPAWAPDGRRIAVSALDVVWTMTPDGRQPQPLVSPALAGVERDPAWSPDGARIAFAADRGTGFDVFVATVKDGAVTPVTALPGDERWPSWTPDGRLVFASRAPRGAATAADPGMQWDLFQVRPVAGSTAWQAPQPLTETSDNETYPRVSPDGALVAFVSERGNDDDADVWVMPLPSATDTATPLSQRAPRPSSGGDESRPTRVLRATGIESHLAWAPDSQRLAFHGVRGGVDRRRRAAPPASEAGSAGPAGVAPRRCAGVVARRPHAARGRPARARAGL
jgi:Tol biopolymer transport system component